MAQTYHIGQKVRLRGQFFDDADVLTNPTTVTFIIREPDDTETPNVFGSSSVVQDADGDFHFDVIPDQEGRWDYRIKGAGIIDSAKEDHFMVRATVFASP